MIEIGPMLAETLQAIAACAAVGFIFWALFRS